MATAWQIAQQNWFGTLLGLIALGIAVFEMLRRRGPRLSYQFRGLRVVGRSIDPLPDGVNITFRGLEVDHLSKTEVILWNAGPAALRGSDIPPTRPLTVSFRQSKILTMEVSKVVRPASNISVIISEDNSSAEITFEFLDKNDGALLTFWHDGNDTTPLIDGVIIGQRSGIAALGRFRVYNNVDLPTSSPANSFEKFLKRYSKFLRYNKFIPYFMITAGIFIAIMSTFQEQMQDYFPFFYDSQLTERKKILGVVLGIVYTLPGLLFLRVYSPKFPKSLLPDDFSPSAAEPNSDE